MQVWHVQHVRNGALESFTQVLFNDRPSYKNLMAIVFDDDPNNYRIAVINLNDPSMKLDPDEWRSRIHGAIDAWNESWDSTQYSYTIKYPFIPNPVTERPETEIERQRKQIIGFVNGIADSTYTEEIKLDLLRGALVTQLKINPDNIISDSVAIAISRWMDDEDDDFGDRELLGTIKAWN